MNLLLTEQTCRICKAKLTEFEFLHKDGLCVDCYKEQEDEKKKAD